ncbi:Tubulin polyglutamylase TTLL5 [Liparis tanakae]|uniref:Tubulin polyglutamylase TTLL5 n=1 Tax=Liparis tanakae TaxID=230148 RepID=A0A4Z2GJI5_9TELE|nr:Tubulin polyglutamylase TTLL5 [Liparis tanakae]
MTAVFAVGGGERQVSVRCHGETETLHARKISPGSWSSIPVKMPAVIREKEEDESSSEDEDHACIAWSGLSKTIPILLFFPEAAVSKDGSICSTGGTLRFVETTKMSASEENVQPPMSWTLRLFCLP